MIQQSLKIKGKTFKCTFTMVSVNSKVNLRASKLACSPGKPKKQRASNIKLEGMAATYTVSVLINPSRIKMAIILPTGQWCAPSAVINVSHGIARYCIVLHGIAWYCMVLHGTAWYYMVLHGTAWYCMELHGIPLYCMVYSHTR